MTIINPAVCNCAICGEEAMYYMYTSYHFYDCTTDLDCRTREHGMDCLIGERVQQCRRCGYVARILSDDPGKVTKSWLKSKAYTHSDGITFRSELADRFYKFYKISLLNENTENTFYALLYAAWACDDSEDEENAARCRRMAIPLLDKVVEETAAGRDGSDEDDAKYIDEEIEKLKMMKADLLRRSGQFETLLSEFSSYSFQDETMNKVLAFQLAKATEKDTACYTVDDAVEWNKKKGK